MKTFLCQEPRVIVNKKCNNSINCINTDTSALEMTQNQNKVETDLNLIIIDAVRQSPKLYMNQVKISAAERQKIWLELAERLNLREQFIKIRWHLLRERFQLQNNGEKSSHNGSNFKYLTEMAFLRPHLPVAAADDGAPKDNAQTNVFKPEFIISEKDLADDGETEEYVFLEVESLEISMDEEQEAEDQQARVQQDGQEIEIVTTNLAPQEHKELMDQLTEEPVAPDAPQMVEAEKPQEHVNPPAVVVPEPQAQEEPTEKQTTIKISSPRSLSSAQTMEETQQDICLENTAVKAMEVTEAVAVAETPVVPPALPQQVAAPPAEKVVAIQADIPPPSADSKATSPTIPKEPIAQIVESKQRCEDDIFGELVSAMLKPMAADRKRAIKKDIMNLLLT